MSVMTEPPRRRTLPASVFAAALVGCLFLGLFALEISHGLIRQNGTVAKSLFALPPVAALLWGLLTRRRWAYRTAQAVAGLAAVWFTGMGVVACVAQPHDEHGPVWVWIAGVSFVLGAVLWAAFACLATPSARRFFRPAPPVEAGSGEAP